MAEPVDPARPPSGLRDRISKDLVDAACTTDDGVAFALPSVVARHQVGLRDVMLVGVVAQAFTLHAMDLAVRRRTRQIVDDQELLPMPVERTQNLRPLAFGATDQIVVVVDRVHAGLTHSPTVGHGPVRCDEEDHAHRVIGACTRRRPQAGQRERTGTDPHRGEEASSIEAPHSSPPIAGRSANSGRSTMSMSNCSMS